MLGDFCLTVLNDPVITSIAASNGCTAAQICLAWARQKGVAVVTKSEKAHRIRENLASANIQLSGEDMQRVDDITEEISYFSIFFDNIP